MLIPVDPNTLSVLYEFVKFWLPIGGLFLGVYKGWEWVKTSINDIKTDVKDVKTGISTQTTALISEIKEQRQDFRAFFAPLFSIAQSQAVAQAQPLRAKPVRKVASKKTK